VYLEYYGLTEPPFDITPNPRFLFYSAKHREAFNHLLYGIRERKGFVQMTGEVGAGKTTLCRAMLEKLVSDLGIAKRIRFVGTQPLAECARYFNLCDVFVDPTLRTDGDDLTIAEAMACAKPVIVSDVGANSTLIDTATTRDGILIPRGDNDALLRETLRVLNDPALAKQMGERAREKIAARFSIEAMVSGMERVYQEFSKLV
jgi:glycosyltransferase involved in cell wall biosynthesis